MKAAIRNFCLIGLPISDRKHNNLDSCNQSMFLHITTYAPECVCVCGGGGMCNDTENFMGGGMCNDTENFMGGGGDV